MNAYELADALLKNLTMEYDCDDYMEQAANMLRQQADRIKKLENKVKSYENLGNMMLDELLEKAQIKELSDEEILNLYKETEADNGGIREFARAILKKASEK